MESQFLIDTNIVIDILGNTMPDSVKRSIARMPLIISAVTYMEALGWHKAGSSQLAAIRHFIEAATILPINQPVVETTVSIRQQKKIGLGDAIIAATALVHHMTLVTRNISDFKSVDGLQVLNPWG
ncbi:MAG: type II toxin-antitoxin system VapC family toxin [Prevotellaceae bacterium]|jgi:predicted nucleic acid-binding protein|nr:type II toxin-antitoxin system VapC family toxin [Prevotellaceae bacterium]